VVPERRSPLRPATAQTPRGPRETLQDKGRKAVAAVKKPSGRKRNKTNRLKAKLRRKRVKQVLRVTKGERKYSR
jgi:hypothetical protein